MSVEDTDIIDRPIQHRGRNVQRPQVVADRVGVKSLSTLWRWRRKRKFPEPVNLNPDGTLTGYYQDEVDAWIANRPRGQGRRPDRALAERARRIEERKASTAPGTGHNSRRWVGPTARFGFVRRAP